MARVRRANVDAEYWLGAAAATYKDTVDIETQPFLRLRFKGRIFIVPAPHYDDYGLSPFGRATRARVAIDTANNELRYMKEYWRDNVAGSTPEATIYDRLNALKIKFVDKMECGGDTGQVTNGHNWTMSPWVSASFVGHKIIGDSYIFQIHLFFVLIDAHRIHLELCREYHRSQVHHLPIR